MGPVNNNWVKENGLHWSAGRIDVSDGSPYPPEYGVALMHSSDWASLSEFLRTYSTPTIVSFEQIIEDYEKVNPPIRWWKSNKKSI